MGLGDHKEVKQSWVNLGMFAARFFPKGSMMRFYCRGLDVWRCGKVGTEELIADLLASESVAALPYGISLLNKDCTWQNIDPKLVGVVPGLLLYLGMQFMNSACQSFVVDSLKFASAQRNQIV